MLAGTMLLLRSSAYGVFGALFALAFAACQRGGGDDAVVQAADLVATGSTFNSGEIVDLGSFTDVTAMDAAKVQAFVSKTPYGTASFLETYSSNGVLAVNAIVTTAQRYTLNPLVFLVRAEMEEGLIGETVYPSSPPRVEYVFGCGCARGNSACDPALAGFDLQVDCLGRALRASLDEVAANGKTASGWGPKIASNTLDNIRVTPADASTAALYQYTPYVDSGKAGGNWLFWNLWQKYAQAIGYKGAGSATSTATIGAPCTSTGTCSFTGGICATNYPGGLCTASCTGTCPTDASGTSAFCADFQGQGGFCLPICNPNASACRSGYSCLKVAQFGDATQTANVCTPQ